MLRTVLAASALGLAVGQGPWNVTLLSTSAHPNARCLDGSPGGYWISRGSGEGVNKWIVHLQGGGWCVNEEDCLGRSKTAIGSSNSWPGTQPSADGGTSGMFSSDPSINPYFASWNKVFVGYCDGASFAGTVSAPVSVSGTNIYFRGRAILDAVVDTLLKSGLSSATHIILKGCSAGGLATFLHADYIGSFMPASASYVAMPGAGFFLDTPSLNGAYAYTPVYQYVFHMQNVSSSVNQACIHSYSQQLNATWHCFMAQYTLPFIKTPLFVSNSLADQWQASNIMDLGCNPTQSGSCSAAQINYLQAFRNIMINDLQPLTSSKTNGCFLQSCFVHVVIDINKSWNGTLVGGQTMIDTFWAWYTGSSAKSWQAIDGPWGGNPTCY